MATVRIVLEFDIIKRPLDLELAVDTWGTEATGDDYAANLRKEEQIERVLKANPDLERQAVVNILFMNFLQELNGFYIKGQTPEEVLGYANRLVLPQLLALVPEPDREALEKYYLDSGVLAGDIGIEALALERISLELRRVRLEDEQGVFANSDEQPKGSKKKGR